MTRPLLELKGFGKIALAPGERGTVSMTLQGTDLRFPGPDLTPLFEAGEVEILLGPAADRARLLTTSISLVAP